MSEISTEQLLDDKQTARFFNLSVACIRKWRLVGTGPTWIRISNRVRYRKDDLLAFLEACPTGGAKRGKRGAFEPRPGAIRYLFCRVDSQSAQSTANLFGRKGDL
jgi:hypothetical protein